MQSNDTAIPIPTGYLVTGEPVAAPMLAACQELAAQKAQLLEACKFTLDLLNNLLSDDFAKGGDKPARDLLTAAIARATGEAQS